MKKFIWDNGVYHVIKGRLENENGRRIVIGTFTTVHGETYPFRSWVKKNANGDSFFTVDGTAFLLDEVEWRN